MKIESLITAYRKETNITVDEIAEYAGISRASLFNRFKDSSQWRLGELNSVYTLLKVPKEERIYQ